ncbi:MAG TPA: VTT domain-containing protein [Acidimicrobiia bacterium]|nr:VTT domain-containing protein [Acidimicrobiia bacterium]
MDQVSPTPTPTPFQDAPDAPVRRPLSWILWFVLALAAVWVTLIFGTEIGLWWDRVSSTLTTPEGFRTWVEAFGAWGPVVFLLAQAVQVILVPIPGAVFPPVGALAFGPWLALGLSLAGMALGSAAVFLVARRWGRPLAVRLVGADRIHRYENLMTARGGLLIWLVFLLPLLPDDALCALAGISGISFRRFMVIATVGRVPAVAAGVFAMAGLEGAPAWVWALAATVFVALLWVGFRYGRALEAHLIRRMRRETRDRTAEPEEVVDRAGKTRPRTSRPDRLKSISTVVVLATVIGVAIGVMAGVSELTTGIILIWGVVLAVMVASARDSD